MPPSKTPVNLNLDVIYSSHTNRIIKQIRNCSNTTIGEARILIAASMIEIMGYTNRSRYADMIARIQVRHSFNMSSTLDLSFKGMNQIGIKRRNTTRSSLHLAVSLMLAPRETIDIIPSRYTRDLIGDRYGIVKLSARRFSVVDRLTGQVLCEGSRSQTDDIIKRNLGKDLSIWKCNIAARLASYAWENDIKRVKDLIPAYLAISADALLQEV